MTTTAAERRAQAKVRYDAFLAVCPSRQLLDRIADKWVTLVLCALAGAGVEAGATGTGPVDQGGPGPMRYSELQRRLAGVSPKMLTQTLRALEGDGLVSRTVTPTVPVTVSYELTDLGVSLQAAVRTLKAWAELHMDDVIEHRARTVPTPGPENVPPAPSTRPGVPARPR